MTTLQQLLGELGSLSDEETLFAAQPWSPSSTAVSLEEDSPEADDAQARGLAYLLEVGLAKDVVDVWSQWRDGRAPTPSEAVEAVIYYAVHDTYLPVENG